MKRIHLARWSGPPDGLGPLIGAARAIGLRVGWLDPGAPAEELEPVPAGLEAAVGAGAFRAVALSARRAVSVKRVSGPPVLHDVLREHFLGCALVVVADGAAFGAELAEEPLLAPADGGYRVSPAEGPAGVAGRVFTPERLAERLRRPRPWS